MLFAVVHYHNYDYYYHYYHYYNYYSLLHFLKIVKTPQFTAKNSTPSSTLSGLGLLNIFAYILA